MNPPPAIEIRNLALSLDGRNLLGEFSLTLHRGRKIVLTGPSGSGKSTLIRCILGFVRPTSGEILVEGTLLTHATIWAARGRLGYVGQEPDPGKGTVRQVLERPFAFHANASKRDNLKHTAELFERFGLDTELLEKDAGTLSGGEKQRISIVSAILLGRDIFLLDEVTSALDKTARHAVAEYFNRRQDISVLFVSHDPELHGAADQILEIPILNS